jgi:hypothetical protein
MSIAEKEDASIAVLGANSSVEEAVLWMNRS